MASQSGGTPLAASEMQENKVSEGGGLNVRYKRGTKGKLVQALCDLLAREMPYCPVRYAF